LRDFVGGIDQCRTDSTRQKSALRVADERGLRITGTLGVLGEGAERGLVDLPAALDRLRKTNFRCSPALLKATLDRFTAR
jgi:predicted nucleic acid-binding protein